MDILYTAGGITVRKCSFSKWVVLTDTGTLPLQKFCRNDLKRFLGVLNDSIFPKELISYVQNRIKSISDAEDLNLISVL